MGVVQLAENRNSVCLARLLRKLITLYHMVNICEALIIKASVIKIACVVHVVNMDTGVNKTLLDKMQKVRVKGRQFS